MGNSSPEKYVFWEIRNEQLGFGISNLRYLGVELELESLRDRVSFAHNPDATYSDQELGSIE